MVILFFNTMITWTDIYILERFCFFRSEERFQSHAFLFVFLVLHARDSIQYDGQAFGKTVEGPSGLIKHAISHQINYGHNPGSEGSAK